MTVRTDPTNGHTHGRKLDLCYIVHDPARSDAYPPEVAAMPDTQAEYETVDVLESEDDYAADVREHGRPILYRLADVEGHIISGPMTAAQLVAKLSDR